ncbi:unnamed protein product [Fusarium graminearum]|nr:unnamed protein product [Fusarium graminearum]
MPTVSSQGVSTSALNLVGKSCHPTSYVPHNYTIRFEAIFITDNTRMVS